MVLSSHRLESSTCKMQQMLMQFFLFVSLSSKIPPSKKERLKNLNRFKLVRAFLVEWSSRQERGRRRSWSWLSNSPNGMVKKKSCYQQKDYTQLYTPASVLPPEHSREALLYNSDSSNDKTFPYKTLIFLSNRILGLYYIFGITTSHFNSSSIEFSQVLSSIVYFYQLQ